MTKIKSIRRSTARRIAAINTQLAKGRKLSSRSVQFIRDLRRRNPAAHQKVKLDKYVQGRVRRLKLEAPKPEPIPVFEVVTYHVKRAYNSKNGHAPIEFEAFSYGVDGQVELWGKVVDLFMELAVAGGWPLDLTDEQEIGVQDGKHGPMVVLRGKGHMKLTKLLKDALSIKGWNYG